MNVDARKISIINKVIAITKEAELAELEVMLNILDLDLSDDLRLALEEGMQSERNEELHSNESVVAETKQRYPDLF